MVRSKQWLLVVPVVMILGGTGWKLSSGSADGRRVDGTLLALESKLGYHLYGPTWLPDGTRPTDDTRQGQHRILQVFVDSTERSIAILAQEPRTEERDAYHVERFAKRAEGKAEINGKVGYLLTGSSGERRLFWNEDEMALIVSSTCLTDDQLIRFARSCK